MTTIYLFLTVTGGIMAVASLVWLTWLAFEKWVMSHPEIDEDEEIIEPCSQCDNPENCFPDCDDKEAKK